MPTACYVNHEGKNERSVQSEEKADVKVSIEHGFIENQFYLNWNLQDKWSTRQSSYAKHNNSITSMIPYLAKKV